MNAVLSRYLVYILQILQKFLIISYFPLKTRSQVEWPLALVSWQKNSFLGWPVLILNLRPLPIFTEFRHFMHDDISLELCVSHRKQLAFFIWVIVIIAEYFAAAGCSNYPCRRWWGLIASLKMLSCVVASSISPFIWHFAGTTMYRVSIQMTCEILRYFPPRHCSAEVYYTVGKTCIQNPRWYPHGHVYR